MRSLPLWAYRRLHIQGVKVLSATRRFSCRLRANSAQAFLGLEVLLNDVDLVRDGKVLAQASNLDDEAAEDGGVNLQRKA
jgi:hypothetical protein